MGFETILLPPVILRPQAEESVSPVLFRVCYVQGRGMRILRFAQNDRGPPVNEVVWNDVLSFPSCFPF